MELQQPASVMLKVSDRPEIRPLTGIRGFAALLVLLTHFSTLWVQLMPSLHWIDRLSGKGFIGVDLFFILSGFILSYVYFEPQKPRMGFCEYRSFIWHRFIRVWPVHFATLILLLGLVLGSKSFHLSLTGKYAWTALPFQLTMTHAWPLMPVDQYADPVAAFSWNYPSWSISAEWFAYLLVFPITWWLLRRCQHARGETAFLLGFLAILIWSLALRPLPLPGCHMIAMVAVEFT